MGLFSGSRHQLPAALPMLNGAYASPRRPSLHGRISTVVEGLAQEFRGGCGAGGGLDFSATVIFLPVETLFCSVTTCAVICLSRGLR